MKLNIINKFNDKYNKFKYKLYQRWYDDKYKIEFLVNKDTNKFYNLLNYVITGNDEVFETGYKKTIVNNDPIITLYTSANLNNSSFSYLNIIYNNFDIIGLITMD